MAAECAYDIDGVVDDAGARVDDDGVSVIVATLIAVRDWRQFNNDLRRHGAEAPLPAGRKSAVAVILPAQAGRKITRAIIVPDHVIAIAVAEVALFLMLVMSVAATRSIVVIVTTSVPVVVIVTTSMSVAMIVVVATAMLAIALSNRGWEEREGCCGGAEQKSEVASIQMKVLWEGWITRFSLYGRTSQPQ